MDNPTPFDPSAPPRPHYYDPTEVMSQLATHIVNLQLRLRARDAAIDRFEVIDETGRILVCWPVVVTLSYEDQGHTLKVFLSDPLASPEIPR